MLKIDKDKFFSKIGYTPHSGQKRVHELVETTDNVVVVCGRRWGKSLFASREACAMAIQPNKRIWIVAPSYKLCEKVWREVWSILIHDLKLPTVRKAYNKQELYIKFPWGSEIVGMQCENPSCFDDQTEILTNDGWKLFKNLDQSELVATINPISKNLEFQKPTEYIDSKYSGDLVSIKSNNLDIDVTPNHRFLACSNYSDSTKFITADKLSSGSYKIPQCSVWIGKSPKNFVLPKIRILRPNYKVSKPSLYICIADWVKFFGIWLAEGSVAGSKGGTAKLKSSNYEVIISQTKENTCSDIRRLLDRLPFDYVENKTKSCNINFLIRNKQLWSYLQKFGNSYTKYIPSEIKELNPKLIGLFLEWFIKGDGTVRSSGERQCFTSSKKLADDLQEMFLKIGKNSRLFTRKPVDNCYIRGRKINGQTGYIISEKTAKYAYTRGPGGSYVSSTPYEGTVYCVGTPNTTVVVRKNGKPYISGNSLVGDECDLIIWDECAKVKSGRRIWEALLEPNLMNRNGKAIFITTPEGRNWVYDFWTDYGENPNIKGWKSYQAPSWDNPHNPKAWIEEKKNRISTERFEQEYGAKFTAFVGRAFKSFTREVHVLPEPYQYDPDLPSYATLDFGYAQRLVTLYLQVDVAGNVVVFDEFIKNQTTINEQAQELHDKDRVYNITDVFADVAGKQKMLTGDTAFEILNQYGINPTGCKSEIAEGLELIRLWLQNPEDGGPKFFVSPSCVETIKAFENARYDEKRGGEEVLKEKVLKDGKHDHIIDAVRYFFVNLFGLTRGYCESVRIVN